jgi:hypothetical protein
MTLLRKILFGLAAVLVIIQVFPASKNVSEGNSDSNIERSLTVPEEVANLMRTSCYDCHSNNTRYPWYAHVQPVGWWLAGHIGDGKEELNFDEFGTYQIRRQQKKLEEIEEMVLRDEMPLPAYVFIHTDAALTAEEKSVIVAWAKTAREGLGKADSD